MGILGRVAMVILACAGSGLVATDVGVAAPEASSTSSTAARTARGTGARATTATW